MASIPCTLLVLLIFLSHDHMGVQGKTPTVFSSLGRDATLLCSNVVYPNCSSTTWLYTSPKAAVEVATHGKINPDVATHRAKRLSLISGCSLHITDVTTEDAVIYTCLQYLKEGGPKNGEDAPVYLSVLQVSASPSETEMKADSHVTLHCHLHTPDHCGVSVADKGVSLSWVDEGGKELQNNNNLKIGTKPPCSITRTEELRGPNSVHTQTCQLTAGGQIQTSVSHIIRVKGVITSTSSASVLKSSPRMENVTTASSNSTSGPSVSAVVPLVAGVVVSVSLLAAALMIIVVIYKRRTNAGGEPRNKSKEEGADLHYAAFQHRKPTQAGPSAKQSEDTVTYSTIMQLSGGQDQNSRRPAGRPADPNAGCSAMTAEEGADLHYASFQHRKPTQAGPSAKQSEDTVTYSTIRGGLAIGDTGGIPGGPTRLGWSKIPTRVLH